MARAFNGMKQKRPATDGPQGSGVIDAPSVRVSLAELLLSRAPLCFPERRQAKWLTTRGQGDRVKGTFLFHGDSLMQDRQLYQQILGITLPWAVERVELALKD